jgi:hypothetical protein
MRASQRQSTLSVPLSANQQTQYVATTQRADQSMGLLGGNDRQAIVLAVFEDVEGLGSRIFRVEQATRDRHHIRDPNKRP